MKSSRKKILGIYSGTLALFISQSTLAQSPFLFSYGGRLATSSGDAVKGPIDLEIKFYREAAGGSPLPISPIVRRGQSLVDGVFQVDLTEMTAPEAHLVFGNQTTWIEARDITNQQSYPRQRLTAVPYAFKIPVDQSQLLFDADGKLTLGSVPMSKIAGLEAALSQKQSTIATTTPTVTTIDDISGLRSALTAKANSSHAHSISDVTGLSAALAEKVSTTSGAISGAVTFGGTGGVNTTGPVSSSGHFLAAPSAGSTSEVRFGDADNSNYVAFKAPLNVTANKVWTLPSADGTSGQFLSTDGGGILSWASPAGGGNMLSTANLSDLANASTARTNLGLGALATAAAASGGTGGTITDDTITDADINSAAAIAQSKIAGLSAALSAKEATIAAGTTAQYYRGDKSWQTLNTTSVPEGTSLYYTDARAKAATVADALNNGAIDVAPSQNAVFDALALKEGSLTAGTTAQYYRGDKSWQSLDTAARGALSITAPLTYNSTTGVFGLAQASGVADGFLSSSDFTVFNNKQAAITASSTVNAGTLTTTQQIGVQVKPFNAAAGNTGEIRFDELAANGTNYVGFKAPDSVLTNKIWTLPSTEGSSGQVLSTNGSGTLSWQTVSTAQDISNSGTPTFASVSVTTNLSSPVVVAGSGDNTPSPAPGVVRSANASGAANIQGTVLAVQAGNGTGTGGSGSITFRTASPGTSGTTTTTLSDRMVIDKNGNVGVGTPFPTATLTVHGTTKLGQSGSPFQGIQFGQINGSTGGTVSFTPAFTTAPIVTATSQSGPTCAQVYITSVSASSFSFGTYNNTGTTSSGCTAINWIAIAP